MVIKRDTRPCIILPFFFTKVDKNFKKLRNVCSLNLISVYYDKEIFELIDIRGTDEYLGEQQHLNFKWKGEFCERSL